MDDTATDLPVKEFFSWEEFSNFFDDWCEKTKSLFYIRSFMLLSKTKWFNIPIEPELARTLKYSSVRLACRNIKNVKRKRRIEKCNTDKEENDTAVVQPVQHEGCGAYILLRLSTRRNSLFVTEYQLTHNHELCPTAFKYNFRKGYLLENSCLPVRITDKISTQFVGAYDIKRLLSYCKSPEHGVLETLSALDCVFASDPGAKVKLIFVEHKVIVKVVFIVTSFMASLCRRFPVILFFHRILSFNKDFDLYGFFCVDANLKGRDCAYVLVRKGTTNILRFALASLGQSVPEIKFRVRCVILCLDIDEKNVVQEIFPNAQGQMIQSQVLQKLYDKAFEMGSKEDNIKSLLSEMAASASSEKYFQAVKELDIYFPTEFVKYFMDEWNDCHEMWVENWCYNTSHLDPALLISHRRQVVGAAVSDNVTVAECILHLMEVESIRESIRNEDDVAIRYHSVCSSENASLIEEELGFSRHGSYDLKNTPGGFLLNDGVSEFFMDRELVNCSCTIHCSSLLPCRHLFAARFRNGEALFDLKLLEKSKRSLTNAS